MKRFFHFLGVAVGGLLSAGPIWGAISMAMAIHRATQEMGKQAGSNAEAIGSAMSAAVLSTFVGIVAWPIGATLCAYCLVRLTGKPKYPPPLPSSTVSPPPISKSHS